MKIRTKIGFILLAFVMVFNMSCDKSDDDDKLANDALVLPPYESMAVDFGDFLNEGSDSGKQNALAAKVGENWLYPRLVVGFWNTALFTQLVVPVTSFKGAFAHKAEVIGENTWQWSYTVDGFASEYTARLTGELTSEEVEWKMYVSKTGADSFEEFLWFSGVSDLDGNSGEWVLNQSNERPDRMISIEWTRENDEIASIKYSWVRELNDEDSDDLFMGSYLEYGLQGGDYDVFYNVHVYDLQYEEFVDVNVEWNRTEFYGRVMAPTQFEDELWHCWDSSGADVACE
ncbi:MAG: hypothetical protein WBM98_19110 [Maribacter sp.]|uniref:hypothetical protein n=1 Tax=Maribacter sp. TaxID=1897614 RepID=UPI003C7100B5